MNIQMYDTKDLIPYENNPRLNDDAVEAVAESIKEFGFKNPIIVDHENVIINGHTRLKAAKKLGLEKVPVIKALDLTPEQVKAYRLADNKVGEIADWDFDLLQGELSDIQLDMEVFGFEDIRDDNKDKDLESNPIELDELDVIIIDDFGNEDIESTYNKLIEEGYNCRISTL